MSKLKAMGIGGAVVGVLVGLTAAGALLVCAPVAMAEFGVQSFGVSALNQNGTPDVQAGSHPYEFVTSFMLNPPKEEGGVLIADGNVKDVEVELPPGFVGDPNVVPKCEYTLFSKRRCPNEAAVGIAHLSLASIGRELNEQYAPIYNLEPAPGHPAEFGFSVTDVVTVFIDVSVRTGGDYGLTATVKNIAQPESTIAASVTFWGVPAAASHDEFRGKCLKESGLSEGSCPVDVPELPLLSNPTSCETPRTANIRVDSWQEPGRFHSLPSPMPEISGCEKLNFSPTIGITPDGTEGSTPTGLNVALHVPQESTLNPVGLAEADVKNTKVTLPAGVQLSPSAADGLLACSSAEIGLHSPEPATCPDASKVGTVEIVTPLLTEPLKGAVYLASPQNFTGPLENPFGSLLALYIVAENPVVGVRVKLAGQTVPDPVTGQLTTTFDETPPLPFSELKLDFYGTDRAPLTTPAACGTYATETTMEPWSGTPAVHPTSSFQITSGPGGAPCASPQPFSPGFVAGSTNLQAGAFTPFTLTMTRPDGDQTLSRLEMHMPPGLLGSLSDVKLCAEPQAAQGACGPESLIGSTIVSAGLGNDPYTVTGGKVYITTAYGGGEYGLSIVNPAAAGPFVLEEGRPVIVRAAIFVDPHTTALTIVSGPIPTILDGIPLQIQHVNVTIERPGFTFNPTNCEPKAVTGTLASSEGATAGVSTPFQVTNCARLRFEPKFSVSTPSTDNFNDNGAALVAKVSYPNVPQGTDADISRFKVELPKALPSRLTTLQKACLAKVFEANPAACPPASFIGHAVVHTPLLPVPLEGPAIFVSHGGEAFPSLIIVLQGYGVTVDLVGTTFISHAGITSTTFKTVPDDPFSTFELTLPEGKYSALASNTDVCKPTTKETVKKKVTVKRHGKSVKVTKKVSENVAAPLEMPTEIIGQNGAEIHETTKIAVTGCKAAAVKKATKKTKKKGKKKQGKK